MPKRSKSRPALASQPKILKRWRQIADYLGESFNVVKRWARDGMPVHQQGRFVTTTPEQLNVWLSQESGKPVHVTTPETDLTSELKRAVQFARKKPKTHTATSARAA